MAEIWRRFRRDWQNHVLLHQPEIRFDTNFVVRRQLGNGYQLIVASPMGIGKIASVPADGNCLFHCIIRAMGWESIDVTAEQLRRDAVEMILASENTCTAYDNYAGVYGLRDAAFDAVNASTPEEYTHKMLVERQYASVYELHSLAVLYQFRGRILSTYSIDDHNPDSNRRQYRRLGFANANSIFGRADENPNKPKKSFDLVHLNGNHFEPVIQWYSTG